MTSQSIRLVWGTPPVPGGRWRARLLNLQLVSPTENQTWGDRLIWRLHVNLRAVLACCLGVALASYLAGAAFVLHRIAGENPHNRVGYLDLALPQRWPRLERLRGEGEIAQARDLLATKHFTEGLALLRSGLARNPDDSTARLDLARIYIGVGLRPRAISLLRAGLDQGYPGREYMETLFVLLEDVEQAPPRAEAARLARARLDALPAGDRPAGDALWIDQQVVRALLADARSAEAVAWVERRYTADDPFRREITAVHLLDTGRPGEAVPLLERWSAEAPRSPEPLRLLARARRELRDFPGLDSALARLRALEPAEPHALLFAVLQNHLAGRPDAAGRSLDELVFRHGGEPGLYPTLATVCVNSRFLAGVARVENESRERGFSPRPGLWARLNLAVGASDWPAVVPAVAALRASPGPDFDGAQTAYLETMRRLALACIEASSGTQSSLVEIIAARPGALPLYRQTLEALLAAGRAQTARHVLTLAEGPHPASPALAAFRVRIESALAASATPENSRVVPSEEFAGPEAFAAAFNQRIDNHDTAGALALLATVRRAAPDWLPAAAARLEALELPVRARGDDPVMLQVLLRSVLVRDSRAPDALLALARELHATGLADNARLIVREILRRQPDHPAALAQLRAWEPAAN